MGSVVGIVAAALTLGLLRLLGLEFLSALAILVAAIVGLLFGLFVKPTKRK